MAFFRAPRRNQTFFEFFAGSPGIVEPMEPTGRAQLIAGQKMHCVVEPNRRVLKQFIDLFLFLPRFGNRHIVEPTQFDQSCFRYRG